MTKPKFSFSTLLVLFCTYIVSAQVKNNEISDGDKTDVDITYYCGLTHQHHDFYSKAFSFQGIELGTRLGDNLIFGIYGSTFISVLDVKIAGSPMYLQMWHCGTVFGIILNESKFVTEGFLLNAGYVSITGDNSNFTLFNAVNPLVKISGLVLTPQLYIEMNLLRWMKCRIGVAYDFYSFRNQSLINRSDLQNFSFNLGFIFGKFSKTNSAVTL